MAESPEEKHIKLLYAIIKQKCLRDIKWELVADELDLPNGHAARMRYSRFKKQREGGSVEAPKRAARGPRKPRAPKKVKTENPDKSGEEDSKEGIRDESPGGTAQNDAGRSSSSRVESPEVKTEPNNSSVLNTEETGRRGSQFRYQTPASMPPFGEHDDGDDADADMEPEMTPASATSSANMTPDIGSPHVSSLTFAPTLPSSSSFNFSTPTRQQYGSHFHQAMQGTSPAGSFAFQSPSHSGIPSSYAPLNYSDSTSFAASSSYNNSFREPALMHDDAELSFGSAMNGSQGYDSFIESMQSSQETGSMDFQRGCEIKSEPSWG